MTQPASAPLAFRRLTRNPCVRCGRRFPLQPGKMGRPKRECPTCAALPPDTAPVEQPPKIDPATLVGKGGFSVAETAAYIGIGEGLLFAMWKRGDGPPRFTLGRRVIVPRSALDAWLEAKAAQAAEEAAR